MSAKERITEILKAYTKKHNISASSVILEEYAEELVRQGAILPPCKVGDTVWYKEGKYFLDSYVVKVIDISEERTRIYASNISRDAVLNANDFGKTVFLTKSQAEEALKNEQEKL